jgi:hypothetical protein
LSPWPPQPQYDISDLEAENSPFAFVRTQAVTARARVALERVHRPPPSRPARDGRRQARIDQARGEREEGNRER